MMVTCQVCIKVKMRPLLRLKSVCYEMRMTPFHILLMYEFQKKKASKIPLWQNPVTQLQSFCSLLIKFCSLLIKRQNWPNSFSCFICCNFILDFSFYYFEYIRIWLKTCSEDYFSKCPFSMKQQLLKLTK